MPIKPISNYVAVVDTLHLNLTNDVSPAASILFDTHTPPALLTITKNNALDSYQSDGFALSRVHHHTDKHFHLCYDVATLNTPPFARLYLDRKAGFENQRQLIPLRMNNAALYSNWLRLVTGFLSAYELRVSTFAQLHIALDTNEAVIKSFFKLQDSPKFRMNHARQLSDRVKVSGTRARGNVRQDSIYIGSAKSAKHTCIYDKTADIEAKGKHYITTWQRANGLDTSAKVERVELRLTNDVFKTYKSLHVNEHGEYLTTHGKKRQSLENVSEPYSPYTAVTTTELDYTRLQDMAYLVSLFAQFSNIDFRHNTNPNISRCKPFPFIDFTIYQQETIMQTTTMKDSKANNFRIEKQSLESQIALFKQTQNPLFLEAAAAFAAEHRLNAELTRLIRLYNLADFIAAQFPPDYFTDVAISTRAHLV